MIRDAVRQFVDNEIRPHREELEHGDLPPYDLLRKLYQTFGMDSMARDSFARRIEAEKNGTTVERGGGGGGGGFTLLPIIELCKCSPGMVTALGVSVGLTATAIMSKGTIAQKERWALDLLTLDKVGAWAITEPNSGQRRVRIDAGDRASRRRRVRVEGFEDLHHERSVRRHDRVHLQARRRQPAGRPQGRAVRAREGHARLRAVEAVAQDGAALVAHRHALPRRRARRS